MRAVAQILFERSGSTLQEWIGRCKAWVMLPRSLWLNVFEFEMESGTGTYMGEGLSFEYFRTLYGAQIVRKKRVPLWKLRELVSKATAGPGIILVEVNRLLAEYLPQGGWDTAPWVRQELDLDGEPHQGRRRAIEATWGRKVRQQRFECRLSTLASDVAVFHREFYVPWLRLRHGDCASIRSLASLRLAVRAGFLLQVWDGIDWIAGVVVVRQRLDRAHLVAPALHSQRGDRLKDGALSAAYYFLFRWARDHGVRFVSLGGSRPNLGDGVYQHKARWGAEPRRDPWHHTLIRFYVDPRGPLPDAVLGQLVERHGRFAPMGSEINQPPDACARTRR